jgi:hypothetical protein
MAMRNIYAKVDLTFPLSSVIARYRIVNLPVFCGRGEYRILAHTLTADNISIRRA